MKALKGPSVFLHGPIFGDNAQCVTGTFGQFQGYAIGSGSEGGVAGEITESNSSTLSRIVRTVKC